MAWYCHMVTWNWVNIGSGNGVLPDGTKPLPQPMLTYHVTHLKAILLEIPQPSNTKLAWKLLILNLFSFTGNARDIYLWYKFKTNLILQPLLPGAKELQVIDNTLVQPHSTQSYKMSSHSATCVVFHINSILSLFDILAAPWCCTECQRAPAPVDYPGDKTSLKALVNNTNRHQHCDQNIHVIAMA